LDEHTHTEEEEAEEEEQEGDLQGAAGPSVHVDVQAG